MKVEMTTSMAGPSASLQRGKVYDLPVEEAVRLIKANFAIPVRQQGSEKATSQHLSEKAVVTDEVVNATDSALKLASQNGVNLSEVTGSGSGGRITKSDVEALIK